MVELSRCGVSILTYGGSGLHVRLVEQLLGAGLAPEQVLLVHNPSTPGETPSSEIRGVRVHTMERNLGYAGAMNRGLALHRRDGREAALLLTHDTRLGDGALDRALAALQGSPRHGVLGFALDQGPAGRSWGSTLHASGVVAPIRERPPGAVVADVPWIDGSAMLIRLAALPADAPFPERYFMYFEEAYLCSAVRRAGWEVGTALAAEAISEPGGSRRPAAYGYLYARNGLDWARTFAGRRAALRFAAMQVRIAVTDLPKPGGNRFRERDVRRDLYALGAGRILGLAAALAGRWGPPPAFTLPGSDIAST